ncbi:hypothetical protein KG088_15390 [Halomonas sp. TRM85114]|nr:hypothetical protein [Halomonas jincaotanensis]
MPTDYDDARRAAAIEAEIDLSDFPERCLYSFDEAMAFVPEAN